MSFIISWIGDAIAPTITSIVETGGVKVAEGIDYVANTVDGVGNKVTGGNWLLHRLGYYVWVADCSAMQLSIPPSELREPRSRLMAIIYVKPHRPVRTRLRPSDHPLSDLLPKH